MVIPSNGATLSGSTLLDASASNATSVEFQLFGGVYGFYAPILCTATPTYYGWLCSWNTTTVPNGSYYLCLRPLASSGSAFSSGVSITVSNPPTTSVLLPSNGATLSGTAALLNSQFFTQRDKRQVRAHRREAHRPADCHRHAHLPGGWPSGTRRPCPMAPTHSRAWPPVRLRQCVERAHHDHREQSSSGADVILPTNGAAYNSTTGTNYFDAAASPGVTQVRFTLQAALGFILDLNATPTIYGWITITARHTTGGLWSDHYGCLDESEASYSGGVTGTSAPVNISLTLRIPAPAGPKRPGFGSLANPVGHPTHCMQPVEWVGRWNFLKGWAKVWSCERHADELPWPVCREYVHGPGGSQRWRGPP